MIVRRFLLWARTAGATERAAAVRVLAEAYVRGLMSAEDRADAETAMLSLLDDPSALVRRTLAETIAAEQAPRAVILGLAQDQPDIAALVLAASPMLREPDLVDAVAIGNELCQSAVARRNGISPALAAAIVEVGCKEAVRALLDNIDAEIAEGTFARAAERFGSEGLVREALIGREDLPAAIRHQLAVHLAAQLSAWAGQCGLMSQERAERAMRDSTEKVAVQLAHEAQGEEHDLEALVAQLRSTDRLTPGLILRSLLSGETALAETALAQLAGMPTARAANILHDRRGAGVAALCRKARIPEAIVPAIVAAAEAVREVGAPLHAGLRARTARRIIERVLIACDASVAGDNAALMALLRRFEAEAAREEAQEIAQRLADDAALQALRQIDPDLTLLEHEPGARLAA